MNDLRREKFEKWCEQDAPHLFVNYLPKLGCYSNGYTQTAWESWCSAIESVVVELPKGEGDECGHIVTLADVEDALDSAGVRYK